MNLNFKPSFFLRNAHLQTMLPSLFRKVLLSETHQESIDADLTDKLDLDWYQNNKRKLVILSHGLEGNSKRPYITAMIQHLSDSFDCLAWNYRTCGRHFTNSKELYHNGKIDDLKRVIDHVIKHNIYDEIHLIGFSMGANVNMLYLAKETPPALVKSCFSISAALDLKSSSLQLEKGLNYIYMKRFLKNLHKKLLKKNEQYPGLLNLSAYSKIRSFREFDERYTAPLHGFKGFEDYWEKCSSRPHLHKITIPVYILSSLDDPFLGKSCYPSKEEIKNPLVQTLYTNRGGHVGFIYNFKMKRTFAEELAKEFFIHKEKFDINLLTSQ